MAGLFEQAPRTTALPAKSAGKKPEALLEKIQAYRDQGLSVLDEFQAKGCLKAAGLPVVEERRLSSLEGIIAAAQELGYPVVLKGLKPGKVHKTEAGWVKLNLHHPDQVQRAFQEIAGGAIKPDAYIVQPMLKGELELIAGMLRDPQFGPAVMLGLGGVRAEVYKDVVFRLAPLNREDVIRMVSKLKGRALLKGFRGSRPVDLDLLAQWLIGLGDLSLTVENIREIDVNPLLIVEGRPVAVDATLILD
jgi:acetyltransferase